MDEEHKESIPVGTVTDMQTPSVSLSTEQEPALQPHIFWQGSLSTVHQLRKAIKRADRQGMQRLWADLQTRHILLLHQRHVGPAYWQRFQALRQLDDVYQDLQSANPARLDPQEDENRFFERAEARLKLEKRK